MQVFYFLRVVLTKWKLLQNWGDYADMNQGGIIYISYACDVLLICWFGTQLTQHVREKDVNIFLKTLST
jgi:hypothetical protein